MIEQVKARLAQLHAVAPESVGDILGLEALEYDGHGLLLRGMTANWMRNTHGTLHGGICATLLDQAMGTMAFCVMPGEGIAPAIDLHLKYHRPLIPGEDVLIRVQVVSVTKSLIHTTAQMYRKSAPDKLCVSASATYFYQAVKQ